VAICKPGGQCSGKSCCSCGICKEPPCIPQPCLWGVDFTHPEIVPGLPQKPGTSLPPGTTPRPTSPPTPPPR
jgi:hypothetical protein